MITMANQMQLDLTPKCEISFEIIKILFKKSSGNLKS